MQTVFELENITKGIFISEIKNRFLCEVNIEGKNTVCYIPSSCRLDNFLELEGKQVLLLPTKTKGASTKYAVFAIPHKRNYILLNSSMANRLVESNIRGRRFAELGKRTTIFREHKIDSYKCDLFIKDSNTLVEIKSIISTDNEAMFPSVYSQRALDQLHFIKELLVQGYKACYIIVSLNPYVKSISINNETEFCTLFKQCIDNGMTVKGFSCKLMNESLTMHDSVNILCD